MRAQLTLPGYLGPVLITIYFLPIYFLYSRVTVIIGVMV